MTPAPRRRWIAIVLVAVAVAAVAFAAGRFSTFGASGPALPADDSAEAGFARDMQAHHTQAIEMAMTAYRKTDDEQVRMLAYDIATAQAGQRGEMFDWLVKWGLPQAGGPPMAWMAASDAGHDHGGTSAAPLSPEEEREAMGMASPAELTALAGTEGTAGDCLFLELMIRHHQGAIPMAEAVLELGSEPRTLAVAASMKDAQQFEIDAMTSMQSRLGCPA
ncbi:DUF305 domain-containing protein [Microbacterium jiangjiandongii]|uniref:DUF305 domain-containing protein n=1 Tax=Microbacterium jiangjiandongii TaxID=3049071 RepID=UPI00214C05F1|nr:DUF305 domain-containing protein [Microbacterium sp. zg.Y843]MCR2815229.1 DUF305 domain-containing protein [Microbacterium sp. zg.Y843]